MLDRKQCGTTLIELVVSLAIGSTLSILFVIAYADISTLTLACNTLYAESLSKAKIASIAQKIVRDLDTHRLLLAPRIDIGTIRHVNGEIIPTSVVPDQLSSILYYTSIDSPSLLTLTQRSMVGDVLSAHVCGDIPQILNLEETYFALTPNGIFEVVGIRTSNQPCSLLTLRSGKGIVAAPPDPQNLRTILKVVRAKSVYAYVRTNRGELRRISFRGDLVIENQPVLSQMAPFRFSTINLTQNILGIDVTIHTTLTPPTLWPFYSKLSRVHHTFYIFNQFPL